MNLILLGKLILIAYICVCYFNIIEIIFKGTNSVTIQILEFETPENKEDVGVCSIPTPGTKPLRNERFFFIHFLFEVNFIITFSNQNIKFYI